MGHHIIMGRKTYESIGRLLPGRTTVIVTRQVGFQVEGAHIAHSVDAALAVSATDECPFVIGGAEIYDLFLPHVSELQLTRVHTEIEGDTFLPKIAWQDWQRIESRRFERGEKNNQDYSFEVYRLVPADRETGSGI